MDAKQFAQLTLSFLDRAPSTPPERPQVLAVEGVLKQILSGALLIGAPQKEKEPDASPANDA
jgi:hypothetical protein